MADDRRVYSEQEFALILRKAAELATRPDRASAPSAGLTLSEMKEAAAQAGFDPDVIERAARLVALDAKTSPFARVIGGPLRHGSTASFPVELDEATAARLLSAVRISAAVAGQRDVGHSGPSGMTWHDGGDVEALKVTARPGADGTAVSITLDRRGTLGLVTAASGVTMFLATLFSVFALQPESAVLGAGGLVTGIGGVLALARGYWASSTKKARERIDAALDAIGQTLAQAERGTPAPDSAGSASTESTATMALEDPAQTSE